MTTSLPARRTRHRRQWLLSLAAALVALVAALVGLALWPPGFYSVAPDRQVRLAGALSMEQKIQELLNGRLARQQTRVVITPEELDGYAAALADDELWHELRIQDVRHRNWFHLPGFQDIRVRLAASDVWVTGTVQGSRPRLVISVRFRPEVMPDGTIVLGATGLRVGRLPVPVGILGRWSSQFEALTVPQRGPWRIKRIDILGGQAYVYAGPTEVK